MGDYNEFKTFVQPPSVDTLYKYLQKNFPGANLSVAYEAGFSGFHICKELENLGITCSVVNPADVPTTDKEKKRKSDPVDSRKIAKSLRAGELECIYIPTDENIQDRAVIRYRRHLITDQTRCKNRIKHFLFFHGIAIPEEYENSTWSKSFLNWLNNKAKTNNALKMVLDQLIVTQQLLKHTNAEIKKLINKKEYIRKIELLQSIPGIGKLSALILLLELADIKRFSSIDKLCAYVGLVPNTHSSGENDKVGGITSRGNSYIKNTLIEASWIVIKKDPEMMAAFGKLCVRMNKNRAIIRIAKKMLARIKAVLTTEQPYELCYNL
jgi:transposase